MIGILTNHWSEFLSGFWNTILCSVIALFFSLILGVGFALLEVAPNKFGRAVAHVYIEIFRNIPLLVITMIFYLVVPQIWFKVSGFAAGTIGLTLYTSAFIAETVRAGINSVGDGQMEGARSNGMTYTQAMRYVILPQALKIVIPPLGNQFINLIKNSSVLAFVSDRISVVSVSNGSYCTIRTNSFAHSTTTTMTFEINNLFYNNNFFKFVWGKAKRMPPNAPATPSKSKIMPANS